MPIACSAWTDASHGALGSAPALARDGASDERLAETPDALAELADEALAEYRAGRTEPLDPEQL